ncbi:MAG TPA: DUF262 domain-containing protein [Anaerolineae bacterium]|nr:DUF262 domain-containing protein [Anaerolineae bacterium]HMR66465.1 DUF262 domain-containing protein [Anaerolineae bacterium]
MHVVRRISTNARSFQGILDQPVFYQVPFFQREFCWAVEQVDRLWLDLTTALAEGKPDYSLGAMVLNQSNDRRKFNVVDGQQRLVVVTLIFAALAKAWRKRRDRKHAEALVERFIGSKNEASSEITLKLLLSKTNHPVFEELVLKSKQFSAKTKRQWPQSNVRLEKAYSLIVRNLDAWLARFDDDQAALLQLEEFLANRVSAVIIEAADASDAFVIFELLHDRQSHPVSLAA